MSTSLERKWRIYLITNDYNDKKYVGQTVKPIKERWFQHINAAANRDDKSKFHSAIRLLGSDHFKVELIEEVYSQEQADVREMYWVSYYDSFVNGYNSTPGGATLPILSNERSVLQVSLDRNCIVERHISVDSAGTSSGLSPSSISYACRNFTTAGGYYWCYSDEYQRLKNYETVTCDGKRYIVKVDIDTFKVLGEYLGVEAAANATGLTQTNVSQICNNQLCLQDIDYTLRWKAVWLKERDIVKTNKYLYKPFYVMMLDPVTLKIIRAFKNSYIACDAFGIKRNTLEKHVNVINSLWRNYLWCTYTNYDMYVSGVRGKL